MEPGTLEPKSEPSISTGKFFDVLLCTDVGVAAPTIKEIKNIVKLSRLIMNSQEHIFE